MLPLTVIGHLLDAIGELVAMSIARRSAVALRGRRALDGILDEDIILGEDSSQRGAEKRGDEEGLELHDGKDLVEERILGFLIVCCDESLEVWWENLDIYTLFFDLQILETPDV